MKIYLPTEGIYREECGTGGIEKEVVTKIERITEDHRTVKNLPDARKNGKDQRIIKTFM